MRSFGSMKVNCQLGEAQGQEDCVDGGKRVSVVESLLLAQPLNHLVKLGFRVHKRSSLRPSEVQPMSAGIDL